MLFVLLIAAIVIWILIDRSLRQQPTGIPAVVQNDPTCAQAATTDDFALFLRDFQAAIRAKDKHKLFSMLDTCSFYWDVLNENERLAKPVLAPVYVPRTYENPPSFYVHMLVRNARSGNSLVFETEEDFLANYDVIFSSSITRHLLGDTPTGDMDGHYEIRWRRNDGVRTLSFDRIDKVGYKFTGLQWSP